MVRHQLTLLYVSEWRLRVCICVCVCVCMCVTVAIYIFIGSIRFCTDVLCIIVISVEFPA